MIGLIRIKGMKPCKKYNYYDALKVNIEKFTLSGVE